MEIDITCEEIIKYADECDRQNAKFHRFMEEDILKSFSGKEFITLNDAQYLAKWERGYGSLNTNYSELIIEVSKEVFLKENEYNRINMLRENVPGIRWEIANAILHFVYWPYDPDKAHCGYPALGPKIKREDRLYDIEDWWKCVNDCRKKAEECGVSMRILSKALWAKNKEK